MELKSKFHILGGHPDLLVWQILKDEIVSCKNYIFSDQRTFTQVLNFLQNKQLQKKVNLVLPMWSNPAKRKLVRNVQGPLVRRISRMWKYPWRKGSVWVFLPVQNSKDELSPLISRNWSWAWYVIMIKMNENLTEQLIGSSFIRSYWDGSETEEHENLQTRIGFAACIKIAARQGSSTVQIQRIPYCTFEQPKDTLVTTPFNQKR